jgi:hypothetical protein
MLTPYFRAPSSGETVGGFAFEILKILVRKCMAVTHVKILAYSVAVQRPNCVMT